MKTNLLPLIALLTIILPTLLAAAEPSAQEQVLLERINRARLEQAAESRRLNLDFQEGMSYTVPANLQPLIWNPALQAAAADQNQDMYARDFFAHVAPDGTTPEARVARHSNAFLAIGQDLGAGRMYANPDQLYTGWMIDAGIANRGHRAVILNRYVDSFGASRADHTLGYFGTYWTANFGVSRTPGRHITGVVWRDLNCNGQYDDGEGLSGWKLRAVPQSPAAAAPATPGAGSAPATAANETAAAEPAWTNAYATGGYTLAVEQEGDYDVEALAPNGDLYLQTVGLDQVNVKVDFETLRTVAPIVTATPTPAATATAPASAGGKKSGCALGANPSTGWTLLCGLGLLIAGMIGLRPER